MIKKALNIVQKKYQGKCVYTICWDFLSGFCIIYILIYFSNTFSELLFKHNNLYQYNKSYGGWGRYIYKLGLREEICLLLLLQTERGYTMQLYGFVCVCVC